MKRSVLVFLLALTMAGAAFAQDECGSAIAVSDGINPSPPLGVSGTTYSNVGMTTSAGSPVPTCGLTPHNDIWFVYTTVFAGSHVFSTDTPAGFALGTHVDTILDVLDAASGCPPVTALGCDDDGGVTPGFSSTLTVTLAASSTYYIRISTYGTNPDGSFYVTVVPAPPPAPNDECATALPLALGVNPGAGTYTNAGASTSAGWPALATCPTASAAINLDTWFSFSPGVTGTYLFDTNTPCGSTAGTMTNTSIALYDGSVVSCAVPGAHMICDGDSGAGSLSLLSAALTAGTTYYLRVGPTGTTGTANVSASFYVNVTAGALPGTVNNECATAIALSLGTNPAPSASCNFFSNDGATNSAGWPTATPGVCATLLNDVWFTFSPVVSDSYIIDTNVPCGFTAGTNTNTTLGVYTPTACGVVAAITCDADSGQGSLSAVNPFLSAGTTYYIRVGSTATTGTGTFYLNVNQGVAVISNDTCASPVTVGLGTNPSPAASCFTYDNSFATTDTLGYPAVCGTIVNDMWFVFTPLATGDYIIDTETPLGFTVGTNTNSTVAVYSAAACAVPAAALACDADSGVTGAGTMSIVTVTNLIAGTPVYIRVGSTSATTTVGTFYLTITPKFSLVFSSPLGPGSIQADIVAGPASGGYFMCVTLNAGAFPAGYFYGIDPFISEIVAQAVSPGFTGVLSPAGAITIGPLGGLPSGVITLYGVGVGFATAVISLPIANTSPESYLVP